VIETAAFDPKRTHAGSAPRTHVDTRPCDLPDALMLDIASAAPLRILLTHIAVYDLKQCAPAHAADRVHSAGIGSDT